MIGGVWREGGGGPPVLLHAEGPAVWPMLAEAVGRGLDTRIGLEDTFVLPGGAPAADNAALVDAALAGGVR
ncbi:3-keto-5-aminohexanoate cleavage protein [Micromonospora sp. CA-111912]|uniref:3-keto-5-aminohexanoate cleavage protein n=1 Tax=Micromonospora sp. CA-111912 TaxID=3239955 RepID=UPI003D8C3AAB